MLDRSARLGLVLPPLLGSAVLAVFAAASLPWSAALFSRPRTPFDRSAARSVAPVFALLTAAERIIPPGASVVARTEPPNAVQETYCHRFAISLLPGRRILASAFYGSFLPPETWKDAEYVVIVGPRPELSPGTLLLETPEGSVWRRARP